MSPIEIYQGDILKKDWSDGDIIFAASVCFTPELIEGIADLSSKLKVGSRLIMLKALP
jgi:hypothetical protein